MASSLEKWTALVVLLMGVRHAISRHAIYLDCTYDMEKLNKTASLLTFNNLNSHAGKVSLSSWTYIDNKDHNRFPHVIQNASCALNGCKIGVKAGLYRPEPIVTQIYVLVRVPCGQKRYRLELRPQNVNVGCTCIKD